DCFSEKLVSAAGQAGDPDKLTVRVRRKRLSQCLAHQIHAVGSQVGMPGNPNSHSCIPFITFDSWPGAYGTIPRVVPPQPVPCGTVRLPDTSPGGAAVPGLTSALLRRLQHYRPHWRPLPAR